MMTYSKPRYCCKCGLSVQNESGLSNNYLAFSQEQDEAIKEMNITLSDDEALNSSVSKVFSS